MNISIVYEGKQNWINYTMRCNSWTTEPDFTYPHYIQQMSSILTLHTYQHPYIQETRKIDNHFHSIYKKLPTHNKEHIKQ